MWPGTGTLKYLFGQVGCFGHWLISFHGHKDVTNCCRNCPCCSPVVKLYENNWLVIISLIDININIILSCIEKLKNGLKLRAVAKSHGCITSRHKKMRKIKKEVNSFDSSKHLSENSYSFIKSNCETKEKLLTRFNWNQ